MRSEIGARVRTRNGQHIGEVRRVLLVVGLDELEQLLEFAYDEILAPPPAWTLAGPYPGRSFYVPK
jgi:hypothetical protein